MSQVETNNQDVSQNSSQDKPENLPGTRLHKLSPLFIAVYVVIKSIIPMAIGIYTYAKTDMSNWLFAGIAVFILLFAILQYWFYHYWIKSDKIEIKEGVLFKSNRKVPYTRIQNVNVSQNILERFFKVATLQLESASGGKPEAVMRVVGLDVVESIKLKVKEAGVVKTVSNNHDFVEGSEVKQDVGNSTQLLRLPTKDVIKYGIISQKGMFYGNILEGIYWDIYERPRQVKSLFMI